MKVAIMQPYFLPYIGYWQLIDAVDVFVVYDNIKYTKKGWINRNRYLLAGKATYFTIPLKNESDFLDVRDRHIDNNFDRHKIVNKIKSAYAQAICYNEGYELFRQMINYADNNLFNFIYDSILRVCTYLKITTKIIKSSAIAMNHSLKSEERVIATCKALGADTYINPSGGVALYSRQRFAESGIELRFIESGATPYRQLGNDFVPWLSILDVIMFNPLAKITTLLDDYVLT